MNWGMELLQLLVFPGLAFLFVYALFVEWVDRRLYARLQHRWGPPWFQPLADFIKLMAKEDIEPEGANRTWFNILPVFAATAVAAAFLYIPVWQPHAALSFQGDLVVVAYLLTIPTVVFFLAGWFSNNPFSALGGVRAVTQLLAYEVPLLLAFFAPAMLAQSWCIADIVEFMRANPGLIPLQVLGFGVAVIALQGKLERVPFDIPEAETEIVAGPFTEFTGRRYGLFRLTSDMEMVVGAALIGNLFLGGYENIWLWTGPLAGFVSFLAKTLFVVFILALIRAVCARIRIEQMVRLCWRYLVPLAVVQLLVVVAIKGWWFS